MDINQKKEQFSKAYVDALAAQIGLSTSEPSVDDDSIDLTITGKNFQGRFRNPKIDVQLKCTASNNGSDLLKFPLKMKNYNDLRGGGLSCPRYLFVLVVPETPELWLLHGEDHSQFFHVCYWYSLMELPDVTNTSAVVLNIPKSQRLTSESIYELMQMASNWSPV
jgi:hypothetical protein